MKKYNFLTIPAILLVLCFLFFWFEIRPAQIKHDCSWVKMHQEARPVQPEITQGTADKEKKACLDGCISDKSQLCLCKFNNYNSRPAIPAEPAKDYRRKAIEKEYDFCIKDKGL